MSNKIGRFEILSEISRSPIGFVYKATDPENGQTVALKVLSLDAMGEHVGEMVQRLVQESQGTSALSSHNISQLLGVDEIEGKFCAALEYVQGNSVATMLSRNEGFSIWDIKDIARQASQALDHAHSRKVFHYSLEPDKIVSQWDGMVKVLGFGVSAMSIPSVQLYGTVPPMMHYMSPEQWMGQPVDARSNIFSLGAILYEMMTEQKAFDGDDEDSLKQQVLEATPVPPHQINNKIALDASGVIMKALSKNPGERFASGQELVAALEGHKETTTVAKVATAAKKTTQPAKGISIPATEKAAAVAQAQAMQAAEAPAPTENTQAAAAVAGWGGPVTGSTSTELPRTPNLDPSEQFIATCVKASIEAATKEHEVMSAAAPVEEPKTLGYKVDPAMVERKGSAAAPTKSFSEMSELPPLKEVYVAPAPTSEEEEPPAPAPQPITSRARSARDEKPKVQPRVVAQKAVQEIKKTPPKLFGYAVAGAALIILLIVGGLAYHIHSENAQDDGGAPRSVANPEPTAARNAHAATQMATEPITAVEVAPQADQEPDVITVRAKPAPKRVKAPPTTVVVPGALTVTSTPIGAQILLDGENSGFLTPVDLTGLAPGQHTITVSKAGYAPETRTIEIASKSKSVMSLQLALMAATFSVTSDPAGAKVFMDGKDMGHVTPLQLSVEKPGNHTILVRKDGYLDESTSLNLQAGQSSHFSPSLRKLGATDDIKIKKFLGGGAPEGTGMVTVKTEPKGAQVAINRRVLDKPSPINFYLNPGTYVVDITASGYKSLQKIINVDKGGKVVIEETLQAE